MALNLDKFLQFKQLFPECVVEDSEGEIGNSVRERIDLERLCNTLSEYFVVLDGEG